jgi:hypothetical protein
MPRGGRRPGAGRPKGSKSKRAAPITIDPVASVPSPRFEHAPVTVALPTDAASLLAYHHAELAAREAELETCKRWASTDARDVTALRMGKDRTLKAIAELTGATRVTEAKIVASDAWRVMFGEIVLLLAKHPEALSELKAYFDSLSPTNAPAHAT